MRNGWRLGRNFALMVKIGTKFADELVDRGQIYWENRIESRVVKQKETTLMAAFHFGLWELLPQLFVRRLGNVEVLVSEQRNRMLNFFLQRLRKSNEVSLVFQITHLLRQRSKTGITGFMLDNTSQGRQFWVELPSPVAGNRVRFRLPTAPFQIARYWASRSVGREKSVVPVFGYLWRGRFVVRVFPAGDEVNALQALLTMVRKMPEEWIFWGKSGAVQEVFEGK